MFRLAKYLTWRPAPAAFLGIIIALVALLPTSSFAHPAASSGTIVLVEETEPPTAPAQTPPQDKRTKPPPSDPIAERIKYLHDRLRITRAQEPLWDNVAQVMRDNADAVAPLIKERVQNAQRGTAIDNLNSYKKLGEAQLEGLDKFISAFRALYESLSVEQKKIADSVFRIGPMGMVGGIPQLAEQFVAPVTTPSPEVLPGYPPYPTYSVYPPYPYYPFYPYYYYPAYRPWIWGPPIGLGASFFFVHGHFHHHGFHHHGFHHPIPRGVRTGLPGATHRH